MKEHERESIPRKTLFGHPERTAVKISHDGTRIAYLAPLDGVLNVWVAPFVQAMAQRGIPVTYLLYPDEGHGFARPENTLSFMAVAEAFLARCLGGRHESVGDDFAGSSIEIAAGVEQIPGLAIDR